MARPKFHEHMTFDEQLERWIAGESVHNDSRDECCPDFSCCKPELLAPMEVRKTFKDANEEDRMQMLMMFLGGAFEGENIHIVGDNPDGKIQ